MFFPELKGIHMGTVDKRTVVDFVRDDLSVYAAALAFQKFF